MKLWTGGYTARSDGNATGIGTLFAGDPDDGSAGGQLAFAGDAAATEGSPSWLTRHPSLDVLYAAIEDAGTVRAFRRTGESSFVPLGGPVEAGSAVCHVAVAPDGGSLIASCWNDGRVVRMSLDAAGLPSAPVLAAAAEDPYGPNAEPSLLAGAVELGGTARRESGEFGGAVDLADAARALRAAAGAEFAHLIPDHGSPDQDIPDHDIPDYDSPEPDAAAAPVEQDPASRVSRAHQAVFLPGSLAATTDMGLDLVRFWRITDDGLRAVQRVVLPRGTGPRHMVWHPSGHLYVIAELSCEVYALAADVTGHWRIVTATAVGTGTLPGDTAAELAASRDGEFLYAGVRGSNTLATLRVRGAGDALAPVALVDAEVDWPRHHVVVRDTVLIAGQRSDDVVSLTLDQRTGVPTRVRHRVDVPSPTCLVPAL